MKHLTKEQLERDLNIRDLSDNTQGPHAMQTLMNEVLDALAKYWNCPVTIYRESPIVSVEDNYDKLGIDKESVLRTAGGRRSCNLDGSIGRACECKNHQ